MSVRVKHHSKGYAALLKHPAVMADLARRAEAVAQAAGGDDEGFFPARSDSQAGKRDSQGRFRDAKGQFVDESGLRRRARAAVVAPMGDPDNKMIRALDAGRDPL